MVAAQGLGPETRWGRLGDDAPAGKTLELLRFVDNFYGSDLCVIYLRREGKQ